MLEPSHSFGKQMMNKLGFYNLSTMRLPDQQLVSIHTVLKDICKDRIVLDIGCSGDIKPSNSHKTIIEVAKEVHGVDLKNPTNEKNFTIMDLEEDDWNKIPDKPWEVVTCCEIIEHMRNVGNFVNNLTRFKCPIVVSTPNPSDFDIFVHMLNGVEMHNSHHVSLFTVRCFHNMVKQYGFDVKGTIFETQDEKVCYSENPFLQSGIMFVMEHISWSR